MQGDFYRGHIVADKPCRLTPALLIGDFVSHGSPVGRRPVSSQNDAVIASRAARVRRFLKHRIERRT